MKKFGLLFFVLLVSCQANEVIKWNSNYTQENLKWFYEDLSNTIPTELQIVFRFEETNCQWPEIKNDKILFSFPDWPGDFSFSNVILKMNFIEKDIEKVVSIYSNWHEPDFQMDLQKQGEVWKGEVDLSKVKEGFWAYRFQTFYNKTFTYGSDWDNIYSDWTLSYFVVRDGSIVKHTFLKATADTGIFTFEDYIEPNQTSQDCFKSITSQLLNVAKYCYDYFLTNNILDQLTLKNKKIFFKKAHWSVGLSVFSYKTNTVEIYFRYLGGIKDDYYSGVFNGTFLALIGEGRTTFLSASMRNYLLIMDKFVKKEFIYDADKVYEECKIAVLSKIDFNNPEKIDFHEKTMQIFQSEKDKIIKGFQFLSFDNPDKYHLVKHAYLFLAYLFKKYGANKTIAFYQTGDPQKLGQDVDLSKVYDKFVIEF
jgi:hypothetical protein